MRRTKKGGKGGREEGREEEDEKKEEADDNTSFLSVQTWSIRSAVTGLEEFIMCFILHPLWCKSQ